jgi:hypothetical protein
MQGPSFETALRFLVAITINTSETHDAAKLNNAWRRRH